MKDELLQFYTSAAEESEQESVIYPVSHRGACLQEARARSCGP